MSLLAILLSLSISTVGYGFQFSPAQLQTLQSPAEFPIRVSILVDLKFIVEINERLGHATFVFYIELRRFNPKFSQIFPENSTEITCGLLPANLLNFVVYNFQFQYILSQDCTPGFKSDSFGCSDGWIITGSYCRVTIAAQFNVRQFPYDAHVIEVQFGHILGGKQYFELETPYTISKKELLNKGYYFLDHMEWTLIDFNCSKVVRFYPGNPLYEHYQVVQCDVQVKRKPYHYIMAFCIPSSVVTTLCLIGVKAAFGKTPRAPPFQLALVSFMGVSVIMLTITHQKPPAEKLTTMQIFSIGLILVTVLSPILNLGLAFLKENWKEDEEEGKTSRGKQLLETLDFLINLSLFFIICALVIWINM